MVTVTGYYNKDWSLRHVCVSKSQSGLQIIGKKEDKLAKVLVKISGKQYFYI